MKKRYQIAGAELVREHGTEAQKRLLDAGQLPDLELDEVIRTHLFRGLEGWPRWRRVKERTVRELAIAEKKGGWQDEVRFRTVEIPPEKLTDEQRDTIADLWELVPDALFITPFWIIGQCGELEVRFPKVRVTIDYHDRIFQQELKL
jgi:hypothetical protein